MGWTKRLFPNIVPVRGKSKIRGSGTVQSHYHYRLDPDLGEGKCAMRRIPCACMACQLQLDKPWIPGVTPENQERYAPVKDCVYYPILDKYNDWIIMPFVKERKTPVEEFQEIHKIVLDDIATNMGKLVKDNNFGVVNANDFLADDFYIVRFVGNPYTLQTAIKVDKDILPSGSMACKAEFFSPAREKSRWYLRPPEGQMMTIVAMRNILVPDLKVHIITHRHQLDMNMRTLSDNEILHREPFFLSENKYSLIKEIQERRSGMEYDIINEDDIDDCDSDDHYV